MTHKTIVQKQEQDEDIFTTGNLVETDDGNITMVTEGESGTPNYFCGTRLTDGPINKKGHHTCDWAKSLHKQCTKDVLLKYEGK